jgi:hypothetical protein
VVDGEEAGGGAMTAFRDGDVSGGMRWNAREERWEPADREPRIRNVKKPIVDPPIDSAAPREGVPAERILRFRTALDLCSEAPEDVPWIVPGYVPKGALVELCGKVKIGKTTLIAAMVRQILDGGTFLGNPVAQGKVLWLTEQPTTSFADALRGAGLEDRDDLVLLQWVDTRGFSWEKVAQTATKKAQEIGAILFLVDTISQFSGIKGDGENSAGEAQRAIEPLQVAAASGLGVIVCRHERKGGGEIGDSGRGSSAWSGAVDVILKITRPEGAQRETLRVLEVSGRFRDAPPEQVIELKDGLYEALGTALDIAAQEARQKILDACALAVEKDPTLTDLVDKLKIKRTTCQIVVERMVADGVLERTGKGKRGDPYRYHQREPEEYFRQNSISKQTVPAETNPPEENVSARTPAGTGRKKTPEENGRPVHCGVLMVRDGPGADWECPKCGSFAEPETAEVVTGQNWGAEAVDE